MDPSIFERMLTEEMPLPIRSLGESETRAAISSQVAKHDESSSPSAHKVEKLPLDAIGGAVARPVDAPPVDKLVSSSSLQTQFQSHRLLFHTAWYKKRQTELEASAVASYWAQTLSGTLPMISTSVFCPGDTRVANVGSGDQTSAVIGVLFDANDNQNVFVHMVSNNDLAFKNPQLEQPMSQLPDWDFSATTLNPFGTSNWKAAAERVRMSMAWSQGGSRSTRINSVYKDYRSPFSSKRFLEKYEDTDISTFDSQPSEAIAQVRRAVCSDCSWSEAVISAHLNGIVAVVGVGNPTDLQKGEMRVLSQRLGKSVFVFENGKFTMLPSH